MERVGEGTSLILGCVRCGAMWLEGDAMRIVRWAGLHETLDEAVVRYDALHVAPAGEEAKTRRATYRERPNLERTCPVCRGRLHVESMGAVQVDVCSKDGAFFDQNELRALHQAIVAEKDAANTKESPFVEIARFILRLPWS